MQSAVCGGRSRSVQTDWMLIESRVEANHLLWTTRVRSQSELVCCGQDPLWCNWKQDLTEQSLGPVFSTLAFSHQSSVCWFSDPQIVEFLTNSICTSTWKLVFIHCLLYAKMNEQPRPYSWTSGIWEGDLDEQDLQTLEDLLCSNSCRRVLTTWQSEKSHGLTWAEISTVWVCKDSSKNTLQVPLVSDL